MGAFGTQGPALVGRLGVGRCGRFRASRFDQTHLVFVLPPSVGVVQGHSFAHTGGGTRLLVLVSFGAHHGGCGPGFFLGMDPSAASGVCIGLPVGTSGWL